MKNVAIADFEIGENKPLAFMVGPCVIEDEREAMKAAEFLSSFFKAKKIPFIFKSSFDKANRSSIHSFRGPGLKKGLEILKKVKETFHVPVVTDIHEGAQASPVGEICDLLQIPAFLCRQTDLLVAAAQTGKPVSVKKGQFMSPSEMGNVVEKLRESGASEIILVDRGASFGYQNLVSDMRSFTIMKRFGVPVCFDATHSVQLPGGEGTKSGGQREFIPVLAKAAVAAGANCLFIEAHPDPKQAKSDSATQLSFDELEELVDDLIAIYGAINRKKKS